MSFRQILISLLYVAVFVLIILIAISILFSTAWSASRKCSTSCQLLSNSRREVVSGEDHPNERWADIPEELYSFFTPPPRFSQKETTERKNKCEVIYPPIGSVFCVDKNGKEYEYLGMAVVLVRRWVLMRKFRIHKSSNKTHKYVRFNTEYYFKGGEIIRVARIVYFKLLASLYLEHPVTSDCIQFATLLSDDTQISIFTGFTYDDMKLTQRAYTRENSTKKSPCSPLFIIRKNTYILCGFIKCYYTEPIKDFLIFQNDNESYRQWIESL